MTAATTITPEDDPITSEIKLRITKSDDGLVLLDIQTDAPVAVASSNESHNSNEVTLVAKASADTAEEGDSNSEATISFTDQKFSFSTHKKRGFSVPMASTDSAEEGDSNSEATLSFTDQLFSLPTHKKRGLFSLIRSRLSQKRRQRGPRRRDYSVLLSSPTCATPAAKENKNQSQWEKLTHPSEEGSDRPSPTSDNVISFSGPTPRRSNVSPRDLVIVNNSDVNDGAGETKSPVSTECSNEHLVNTNSHDPAVSNEELGSTGLVAPSTTNSTESLFGESITHSTKSLSVTTIHDAVSDSDMQGTARIPGTYRFVRQAKSV